MGLFNKLKDAPENYIIGNATTYFDLVSQTLKNAEA